MFICVVMRMRTCGVNVLFIAAYTLVPNINDARQSSSNSPSIHISPYLHVCKIKHAQKFTYSQIYIHPLQANTYAQWWMHLNWPRCRTMVNQLVWKIITC